jgi:hypothetical protein
MKKGPERSAIDSLVRPDPWRARASAHLEEVALQARARCYVCLDRSRNRSTTHFIVPLRRMASNIVVSLGKVVVLAVVVFVRQFRHR